MICVAFFICIKRQIQTHTQTLTNTYIHTYTHILTHILMYKRVLSWLIGVGLYNI